MKAVRAFADKYDLGYTIHLNQSIAEYQFMEKFHGLRPAAYLDRHGFLGPRLFAAHARYVDASEIALLGKTRTIILNTLKPYLVPAGRLVSAVIHGGHPSDIESVMIDGEFVMRDNKVLTMDEGAVLREADAVGKRIWKGMGPVNVPRLPRPK